MNDYTLSVIVPNYNKQYFIGECLESILNQSLAPDEIIVVDDCSTDGSVAVIKEYEKKHKNIKGIYLTENGGVSHARNCGLQIATSKYVTFTDSDDIYYSCDKLKNEMSLIKAHVGEEVVAYSPFVRIDEKGTPVSFPKLERKHFSQGKIIYDLLSRYNSTNIPRDYCVKKDVLMSVGAYSYYKNFYEDLDLLIRLSQRVDFYCTYQYGMAYRMTSGGLSKRKQEEHISTVKEIICNYKSELSLIERLYVVIKSVAWKVKRRYLN